MCRAAVSAAWPPVTLQIWPQTKQIEYLCCELFMLQLRLFLILINLKMFTIHKQSVFSSFTFQSDLSVVETPAKLSFQQCFAVWDKTDWMISTSLSQVTTPCASSPWTGCWCSSSRTATPSAGSCLVSCCRARWSTTPEQTASSLCPLHASWRATSKFPSIFCQYHQ